ncbi:MAG: hypothetical protein RMX96_33480 [Nostoc sp. ChiSLP02]|nr:hypothetical protein [Nostoc sp. DedSLP05]MDZ8101585.1 hypothetical protein [Nostoc sp. DedSLP01]MDZ8189737.1 hypothetical protein [Nostoc sp. ChiSLP02]
MGVPPVVASGGYRWRIHWKGGFWKLSLAGFHDSTSISSIKKYFANGVSGVGNPPSALAPLHPFHITVKGVALIVGQVENK